VVDGLAVGGEHAAGGDAQHDGRSVGLGLAHGCMCVCAGRV
jgi:hypothetical protein